MRNGRTATSALLTCGVVGPPLFISTFLLDGATRPGYNAWRNFVSQLSTGDRGFVQIANFIVLGTLALGFAAGLARLRLRSIAIVQGVYGTALLAAGIFVTDPGLGYPPGVPQVATTHGAIHGVAALAAFTSNALACFVTAFVVRGDPRWRGWFAYSIVSGTLVLAVAGASSAIAQADEAGRVVNGPSGLVQRVSVVIGLVWLAAFALRLKRGGPPA
ncbi:MAG TPA: DUF998 domain-containing protein [Candidatus Limnocylindrales bacterium]|nr:DUF998 domain-containing protein [Candidatus Limnocylindrales bacterium]